MGIYILKTYWWAVALMLIYLGVMQSSGWNVPVFGVNGVLSSIVNPHKVILRLAQHQNLFRGHWWQLRHAGVPWRTYLPLETDVQEVQDVAQLSRQTKACWCPFCRRAQRRGAGGHRGIAKGVFKFTTWAAGTRNAKGEWEGWQLSNWKAVKMNGEIRLRRKSILIQR